MSAGWSQSVDCLLALTVPTKELLDSGGIENGRIHGDPAVPGSQSTTLNDWRKGILAELDQVADAGERYGLSPHSPSCLFRLRCYG